MVDSGLLFLLAEFSLCFAVKVCIDAIQTSIPGHCFNPTAHSRPHKKGNLLKGTSKN